MDFASTPTLNTFMTTRMEIKKKWKALKESSGIRAVGRSENLLRQIVIQEERFNHHFCKNWGGGCLRPPGAAMGDCFPCIPKIPTALGIELQPNKILPLQFYSPFVCCQIAKITPCIGSVMSEFYIGIAWFPNHYEFTRWPHELSVTTSLWKFRETEFVYLQIRWNCIWWIHYHFLNES